MTARGIVSLALLFRFGETGSPCPVWGVSHPVMSWGGTPVLFRGYPCPVGDTPVLSWLGTPSPVARTWNRTSDRTRGYFPWEGYGTRGWEGTWDQRLGYLPWWWTTLPSFELQTRVVTKQSVLKLDQRIVKYWRRLCHQRHRSYSVWDVE